MAETQRDTFVEMMIEVIVEMESSCWFQSEGEDEEEVAGVTNSGGVGLKGNTLNKMSKLDYFLSGEVAAATTVLFHDACYLESI